MKIIMNDSKKPACQPPPSQGGLVTSFTQGEFIFTKNNSTGALLVLSLPTLQQLPGSL